MKLQRKIKRWWYRIPSEKLDAYTVIGMILVVALFTAYMIYTQGMPDFHAH